jgi:uncharacterized protein
MIEPRAPGIYIEEVTFPSKPIQGVATSTTGFIGVVAQRAPVAGPLTTYAQFEAQMGANTSVFLTLAVKGFFENGGQNCYVARIGSGDPLQAGLDALANAKISIVCCPDDQKFSNAGGVMAADCQKRKDRMCILQSAQASVPDASNVPPVNSTYAAYYYPWVTVAGLDGKSSVATPPCGHLAGVYARTDAGRGVWAAPAGAGAQLMGVTGLAATLADAESAGLDARGVNVLRTFPALGNVVWGAQTTSQDPQWKYVNVRRLLLFIEQSLSAGLQWVVFEPNGPALWAVVKRLVAHYLTSVWQAGGLAGQKQDDAYFVRCDLTTMTQADLDQGTLVMVIGVAPLAPAEFVVIQISSLGKKPPK